MTKKHFIELADMMRRLKPTQPVDQDHTARGFYDGKMLQWELTREALVSFCKSQNSAFMRGRWIEYIEGECGPNGGKVKKVA